MRKSYLLFGLVVVALFLFSGCSSAPTIIGDNTRMGYIDLQKPVFGKVNERLKYLASFNYEMISKGESLTIKVRGNNSVCTASLKLFKMNKSQGLIPFFGDPEANLLYKGKWEDDMSSECLKIVEKPGGTALYVQIWEPSRGKRSVIMCSDQAYTLYGVPCNFSALGFQIPLVEGVDD